MTSQYSLTFLDRSRETSIVSLNIPSITPVNFANILTGGIPAALSDAIATLSLCTPMVESVTLPSVRRPATTPASPYAQREIAIRVAYQDNTTLSKYSVTIPGADLANLGQADTDLIAPDNVVFAAFVSVFEGAVVSPDGNTVTVLSGRIVGRAS
jgi:hypothetical protein